jgi:hypothetical protein
MQRGRQHLSVGVVAVGTVELVTPPNSTRLGGRRRNAGHGGKFVEALDISDTPPPGPVTYPADTSQIIHQDDRVPVRRYGNIATS